MESVTTKSNHTRVTGTEIKDMAMESFY